MPTDAMEGRQMREISLDWGWFFRYLEDPLKITVLPLFGAFFGTGHV